MDVITQNPFYILELSRDAGRMEIQRQGQKILGMMAGSFREASDYPTPLGLRTRTEEMVRWAIAELQDANRRYQHELWACLPTMSDEKPPEDGHFRIDGKNIRHLVGW